MMNKINKAGIIKKLEFKRWTNTSYGIFMTIKREIKICILAISYFCCLGYQNTFAATETDSINRKITLDEVEVSARRAASVYSEVGRVVTVFTRDDISLLPVQSIQELLGYAMSVDIRARGPLGMQADVSMRGGSFDQVMILLNGINITDPQTGHHALNLPVDLESIERVEILQGPAARVYGPNAFSGAINFITSSTQTNKVTFSAMEGGNELSNTRAGIVYNHGAFGHFLSVQKAASDGYIPNTDFKLMNLFYNSQLKINQEELSLQLGYNQKAFGANSFYTALYPNQFEKTRTLFASLSMQSGTTIKVRPNVYWRRHHDRFELFRDFSGALDWYTGHNYHLTDVYGAGVNVSIPWVFGTTSIGGEVRSETVWSNVLGYEIDKKRAVPGEKGAFFTRNYNRSNASAFIEHNVSVYGINISGGLLINTNTQSGFNTDFFPGVDVSYWLTPNVKLMAAYNESLRLPTFTDMFYSTRTHVGNANLKPEKAATIESGVRWRSNLIDAYFGGFSRTGEDLIDWGRLPGETVYSSQNISEVKAYGVESSVKIDLLSAISAQQFFRSLKFNYYYIHQDKKADENYESIYVLDHLRHKINTNIEHAIGVEGFTVNWNVLYRDRLGYYTNSATASKVNYEPFWITDFRLTWSNKNHYRIYGEATNLFDKKYADIGELIQPGRWIKFGFAIDLDY